MKTWIKDGFPLDKLECQYFDICRYYDNKKCTYSSPCPSSLDIDKSKYSLRKIFKMITEDYAGNKNLEFQIGMIIDNDSGKNGKT